MHLNSDITPPEDPWLLFREWYSFAEQHEPDDTNAMALATADANGMPSLRIVLLKSYENGELVFFTNRESRKGNDLHQNPNAALCLYWKALDRQIRAEGAVEKITDVESDAYFATRPRQSQIGAWVSKQSRVLVSREAFEEQLRAMEQRYEGQAVPRPPYWGGYRLLPLRFEFWQERPFRLHDRIVYHRPHTKASWAIEKLYP